MIRIYLLWPADALVLGYTVESLEFFITDCVAKATMTFHFPAPCRANYFPGFPVKFSIFCLSSFHVYRQCSPVQIKYVSFADRSFASAVKL